MDVSSLSRSLLFTATKVLRSSLRSSVTLAKPVPAGFKTLNQAQLLTDVLYYPNVVESQQWLVYYISRPLIGTLEPVQMNIATLATQHLWPKTTSEPADHSLDPNSKAGSSSLGRKDVRTFNDLLNNFPMIARQMQAGLEHIFKEFHTEMNEKASAQSQSSSKPSRRASESSSINESIHSKSSIASAKLPVISTFSVDEAESHMRRVLETAVIAAIDLFQLVDKQQLSFLGATTELTGSVVERLIERYISEQLHGSILFPTLCNSRKLDDLELESQIRQMAHLDVSQVGIVIENGRQGKEQLLKRLARGVKEFRRLSVATSPQDMIEILVATQKALTNTEPAFSAGNERKYHNNGTIVSEKLNSVAMNADTLVSLLLVVVIRSQVRHLQARLIYMRNFIFIDDVESGEIGYALSTFEAVLSYLVSDSGGLRRASRRNNRLWKAARSGDISALRALLEPNQSHDEIHLGSCIGGGVEDHATDDLDGLRNSDDESLNTSRLSYKNKQKMLSNALELPASVGFSPSGETVSLTGIAFRLEPDSETADVTQRKMKRVSMDMRSLSSSSEYSFRSQSVSRTSTVGSVTAAIEGDTSIETLSQTQDSEGSSLLMMAVFGRQSASLEYLLSLENFYPLKFILEDSDNEGTTLLSAAMQTLNSGLVEIILQHILKAEERQLIINYFAQADLRGRTMAHYLFHVPDLIGRFGNMLPWRQKDKHGQTPLLALCRSYDHPNYSKMVSDALHFAALEQNDGQPLYLDNHVDGKGNTLLHVVNDPQLAIDILRHCDIDANALNDKRFTPLMVASKYGRVDMVRAFFGDSRVDTCARELRGMTAVELAKDDEVRNRIDDMVLVSNVPASDGRVTAVVRSFFVEDASIRLIIKSAIRNGNGMIGITTCRRSLSDFENLAKWLSVEHPASWIPSIFNFRSPFQLPSKPSRAALQDIQVRLDKFLKVMLAHSTFSTHELLWEFILFPEIQPEMMAERSRKKAELRIENIKEQYEPVDEVQDVESFMGHARELIRGVNYSNKAVTRRVSKIRNASSGKYNVRSSVCILLIECPDLAVALDLCARTLSTFQFLPGSHLTAFTRYSNSIRVQECDPYKFFHQDLQAISSTTLAILSSISRPYSLINSLFNIQKAIDRHTSSLRRSDRWPLGLLDETRRGIHAEAQERAEKSKEELRTISCELRYTQHVVAGELAGWQDLHAKMGKRAIRSLAERMIIREKDRLAGMRRAMRNFTA